MKTTWDILREAELAGWEDPGFTEPLEETINRAKEFLRSKESTQITQPVQETSNDE